MTLNMTLDARIEASSGDWQVGAAAVRRTPARHKPIGWARLDEPRIESSSERR
jgi:hypothetical protein